MSTENKDTEKRTSDTPIQAGALTQLLSQYRTDAHLGHEQVSEALCLPVSSVKALENEEFDKLPESPYIRGYLRTYARLANQDPTEAIKIYDTLHGGHSSNTAIHNYTFNNTSETNKRTFSESGIRFIVFALILSALALLAMIPAVNQWLQTTWDSFSAEQVTSEGNTLPGEDLINPKILIGDIPGNLPVSDKPDKPKKPDSSKTSNTDSTTDDSNANNSATATTEKTDTDTTLPNTAQTENNTTETENSAENNTQDGTDGETDNKTETATNDADSNTKEAIENGKVKIKLVFSDEVWLRIKNEKRKTVFEALNPADTEKELVLTPPLKLKVGSAHGLKIYVNGKEKDITEYTKGSIARFSIEKEEAAQSNNNENTPPQNETGNNTENQADTNNTNTPANENTE